jgi:hypothetical protein
MQILGVRQNQNPSKIMPKSAGPTSGRAAFKIALLLILPALICVAYVLLFGVDIPILDEWYLLNFYKKWQLHQINIFDVLAVQHNEHRIGVAYFLELLLAHVTHCSSIAQMYLFVGCRILTAALLIDLLRQVTGSRQWFSLLAIPVVLQVLTIRQWENLLWGFQSCIGLSVLFTVSAIWLLCKEPTSTRKVLTAAVAAGLSSYCFASGLAAWPVGSLILVSKTRLSDQSSLSKLIIWFFTACTCVGLYFWNYHHVSDQIQIESEYATPFLRAAFFIGCLGNSVGTSKTDCVLVGFIVLISTGIIARAWLRAKPKLFFDAGAALFSYGLACVIMIGLGRCDPHGEMIDTSRYSSLTAFVLIGLYFLVLRKQNFRPFLASIIAITIIFGYARSVTTYWNIGAANKSWRQSNIEILRNWGLMTYSARTKVFQAPNDIEPLLLFLKQRRLSTYRQINRENRSVPTERMPFIQYAVASTVTKGDQNLVFPARSPAKFVVAGWAAECESKKPLKSIWVVVDDIYMFSCTRGELGTSAHNRPKNYDSDKYGFFALLSPSEFNPGSHNVKLKVSYENGNTDWESGPITRLRVE